MKMKISIHGRNSGYLYLIYYSTNKKFIYIYFFIKVLKWIIIICLSYVK
jgi:hypothetical protein